MSERPAPAGTASCANELRLRGQSLKSDPIFCLLREQYRLSEFRCGRALVKLTLDVSDGKTLGNALNSERYALGATVSAI